jgi:DNA polymerase I
MFKLMIILEEAYHRLIIVEHDPLLYEDSAEMVEYISQALKQASHEATVLLYSLGIDPFLGRTLPRGAKCHLLVNDIV